MHDKPSPIDRWMHEGIGVPVVDVVGSQRTADSTRVLQSSGRFPSGRQQRRAAEKLARKQARKSR